MGLVFGVEVEQWHRSTGAVLCPRLAGGTFGLLLEGEKFGELVWVVCTPLPLLIMNPETLLQEKVFP